MGPITDMILTTAVTGTGAMIPSTTAAGTHLFTLVLDSVTDGTTIITDGTTITGATIMDSMITGIHTMRATMAMEIIIIQTGISPIITPPGEA